MVSGSLPSAAHMSRSGNPFFASQLHSSHCGPGTTITSPPRSPASSANDLSLKVVNLIEWTIAPSSACFKIWLSFRLSCTSSLQESRLKLVFFSHLMEPGQDWRRELRSVIRLLLALPQNDFEIPGIFSENIQRIDLGYSIWEPFLMN